MRGQWSLYHCAVLLHFIFFIDVILETAVFDCTIAAYLMEWSMHKKWSGQCCQVVFALF